MKTQNPKIAQETTKGKLLADLKIRTVGGFKKTYSDDKSCYWYEKKIKHEFLKNVEVIVGIDPKRVGLSITCFCDLQGDDCDYTKMIIYNAPYFSELDLIKFLNWLEYGKKGHF